MLILREATYAELMVKNSRFVAEAIPAADADAARAVWRGRKKLYDNGGHIVYAFVVGPQGNIMGCSDDGEPSGTAGRPALAVVKGSGITNIIVTIARWFGGTKLGAGGLVRAYSDSAKAALENAVTTELIDLTAVTFRVAYSDYELCRKLAVAHAMEITGEEFAAEVRLSGTLPAAGCSRFLTELADLTNGRAAVEKQLPV